MFLASSVAESVDPGCEEAGSVDYHSNTPTDRAAVNQENLTRQVGESPLAGFRVGALVAPAGVTAAGYSTRCEEEPEKKTGNQSAHVRGHADLRGG